MRITLFVPCFVDAVAPGAARATVALLRRLGHEVVFPAAQTCCGQIAFNTGNRREAALLARRFCEIFAGAELVVAPSGSCVAMVRRHHPELLDGADDHGVPARTFELCELLVDVLGVEELGVPGPARDGGPLRAGLHVGCHQRRELGSARAALRLLERIPGLVHVPTSADEQCCGFGGAFSVKLPEVSAALADWKLSEAAALGLDVVVSTDPSCGLQLGGRSDRDGGVPVVHIAELLAGGAGAVPRRDGPRGEGARRAAAGSAAPAVRAPGRSAGGALRRRMAELVARPRLADKLTQATVRSEGKRAAARQALPAWDLLRRRAGEIRRGAAVELEALAETFRARVEAAGGRLIEARDAADARQAVVALADERGVRLAVKSKSMVTEEVELNPALEAAGVRVLETDLGEFVVQLAGERPSHVTAPCIHMSAGDIARLFEERIGVRGLEPPPADGPASEAASREVATRIMAAARAHLRPGFHAAELGISGANFLVAETGHVVVVENEANARLTTSLPPLHVTVAGLDKLVPRLADLGPLLSLLAPSATGQLQSCYVNVIPPGPDRVVVLLDNGRRRVAADPDYGDVARCIRCGACMNACPVFRQVGGHGYGGVYPGPLGIVLLPLLGDPDRDEGADLAYACSLCDACREACPVGVPLPDLIRRRRERSVERANAGLIAGAARGVSRAARHPALWSAGLRAFRLVPRRLLARVPGGREWLGARDLPAPGPSFRAWWASDGAAGERPAAAGAGARAAPSSPGSSPARAGAGEVRAQAPGDPASRAEGLARFEAALRAVGGDIDVVRAPASEGAGAIAAAIGNLCGSLGAGDVRAAADVPDAWLPAAAAARRGAASPPDDVRVGVTIARALIASTGTLVVEIADRGDAAASLLCDRHVAVVPPEAPVFADPVAFWAGARAAGLLGEGRGWLVQVTGPSRTADVEKILVIPAHGPRAMTVVLVEAGP